MKKNGFVPLLIILAIAILGVVGYFSYKGFPLKKQLTNNPLSSPSVVSSPMPTPFLENLKDISLEKYLKNTLSACVEYFGENKCDETKNYAVIQIINKNYAYGGFDNDQVGFQFAAIKINGVWTKYYTGGGGIPDCREISNLPPGVFGEDILNACFDGKQTIIKTTGKSINESQ